MHKMKTIIIALGFFLSALVSLCAGVCKEYVSTTTRGSAEINKHPVIICGRIRDLNALDKNIAAGKGGKSKSEDYQRMRDPFVKFMEQHGDTIWFVVRILLDLVGIASVGQYVWRSYRPTHSEVHQNVAENVATRSRNKLLSNRVRHLTSQLNAVTLARKLEESNCEDGDQNDARTLAHEHRALKDQLTCKICMDKEIGVIFWPCSHITCCPECAIKCVECPVCRTLVYARMKAYIN